MRHLLSTVWTSLSWLITLFLNFTIKHCCYCFDFGVVGSDEWLLVDSLEVNTLFEFVELHSGENDLQFIASQSALVKIRSPFLFGCPKESVHLFVEKKFAFHSLFCCQLILLLVYSLDRACDYCFR